MSTVKSSPAARRGSEPPPADRDERLKHIRCAALLLGGTHSASALARSHRVSVETIYRWRDLALTYDEPEAAPLRRMVAGKAEAPNGSGEAHREPAPHVACIKLGGEWFRLRIWSDAEWRSVLAGEWADLTTWPLSGFGMVSVERVTGDAISNAAQEAQGLPAAFPELEELTYLSARHGHAATLRVARLAVGCGLDRAASLLRDALASDDETAICRKAARDFAAVLSGSSAPADA